MLHRPSWDYTDLQKSILAGYMNVNTTEATTEDLKQKILETQKHLLQLVNQLQALDNSSGRHLTLESDWMTKSLAPRYPAIASLTSSTGDGGVKVFHLVLRDAPMKCVYNGAHPFYITDPCLHYEFKFSPNNYGWFRNLSETVIHHRMENIVTTTRLNGNSPPEGYGRLLTPTTHPHSASSSRGRNRFNDICTGPDNPFFNHLRSTNHINSMSSFKSMLRLGLDWLHTYNVNDAYSGQTPWHMDTMDYQDGFSENLNYVMDRLGQPMTMEKFEDNLITLLLEAHWFLRTPGLTGVHSFKNLWSETSRDIWDTIAGWEQEDTGTHHCPILNGLHALAKVFTERNTASTQERTLNALIAAKTQYLAFEDTDPDIRYSIAQKLTTWLAMLEAFKCTYAILLLISMDRREQRITGRDHMTPILYRDALAPAITDKPFNPEYVNRFIWYCSVNEGQEYTANVRMPEYHACLDNLFEVINPSAVAPGTVLGKLKARYTA